MKRIHPKLGFGAAAAVPMLLASLGGCNHNSPSTANPFLAPTRVPPPSTRPLAPGTAEPYYPGDPLPVMQSAAPPSSEGPSIELASAADPPRSEASTSEPAIAIPSDDNSVRIELPPPAMLPATTTVAAEPPSDPSTVSSVVPAAASEVVPAIYQAAPVASQAAATGTAAATTTSAAVEPWRSPAIVATSPPVFGQPGSVLQLPPPPTIAPANLVAGPAAEPSQSIGVSMRAVPSPPPESVAAPTPRIRLPGYPAPAVTLTAVPSTPASGSSPDGFRPRSNSW